MAQTTRDFVRDTYRLISAHSPTVPLHGDDQSKGLQYLNELLQSYGSTGLLISAPTTYSFAITAGQGEVVFTRGGAYGRLANPISLWLSLSGTDYPLEIRTKDWLESNYKYGPLQGLPLYAFFVQGLDESTIELYPAPSQGYTFNVYGKFEVPELTLNDTMANIPGYYIRFLRFALARDICSYKGREEAWTPNLEAKYKEARKNMIAASPLDLRLGAPNDDMLNGAARVRAGV